MAGFLLWEKQYRFFLFLRQSFEFFAEKLCVLEMVILVLKSGRWVFINKMYKDKKIINCNREVNDIWRVKGRLDKLVFTYTI